MIAKEKFFNICLDLSSLTKKIAETTLDDVFWFTGQHFVATK